MTEQKVWIPASAGPPEKYGTVHGDDGRGWSLVTTTDLDGALTVGGFVASEAPEQYLER
jgi:hypothetical protein